MSVMETDLLVKLRDAARRVGVSVRTVYREIADGKLPPVIKVRGCSLLAESAINEYVERQKRGGGKC